MIDFSNSMAGAILYDRFPIRVFHRFAKVRSRNTFWILAIIIGTMGSVTSLLGLQFLTRQSASKNRECKVMDSGGSQDFYISRLVKKLYWFNLFSKMSLEKSFWFSFFESYHGLINSKKIKHFKHLRNIIVQDLLVYMN